jgi:hypothetical protein
MLEGFAVETFKSNEKRNNTYRTSFKCYVNEEVKAFLTSKVFCTFCRAMS